MSPAMASRHGSRSCAHSTAAAEATQARESGRLLLLQLPDTPPRGQKQSPNSAAVPLDRRPDHRLDARLDLDRNPATRPPSIQLSWGGTFLSVDDPPAASVRDSFVSIVDDPFFQRYHAVADALGVGQPAVPQPPPQPDRDVAAEPRDEPSPLSAVWPPPRRESLSTTSSTPWVGPPAAAPSPREMPVAR